MRFALTIDQRQMLRDLGSSKAPGHRALVDDEPDVLITWNGSARARSGSCFQVGVEFMAGAAKLAKGDLRETPRV